MKQMRKTKTQIQEQQLQQVTAKEKGIVNYEHLLNLTIDEPLLCFTFLHNVWQYQLRLNLDSQNPSFRLLGEHRET